MNPTPIILDCDPGHDDALAIILAAYNPAIDLRGITTVSGNGGIDKVTQNALRVCALAKIQVPVAQGSGVSLMGFADAATDIHGASALDGAPLPEPTFELSKESGVELIARLVEESVEPITLVATGPLTNIALFLKLYPQLISKIAHIVFMGGSAGRGNRSPYAEFNIWMDPEAAEVVLHSGLPLTMCGLDVTHEALVTTEVFAEIQKLDTHLSTTVVGLLHFFREKYYEVFEMPDPPLHDPVAIAVLIDPTVVTSKFVNVEVELEGVHTRGATVVDIFNRTHRTPNTTVALSLDAPKFWALMTDAIEKAGLA
ncbi:MAG: nucleoside hydrolase [Actinobacteria bacterium]|nr:nucleoside hydrolase [Actinomycetota bacterium]